MAENQQAESLLDDGLNELKEEQAAEQEANPEVIEDVLVPDGADPIEQTVATEEEDVEYERPEYFPEKFWDDKEGPDIEGLVKSYGELEKNFSQGKHKAPEEGYDISFAEQKGIAQDDALLGKFQGWAKEHGVSQAAFEALAKDYIDTEMSNLEQYDTDVRAEKAKLGPDADTVIRSTVEWVDSLHKKGILNETELDSLKMSAGTADGVRALQKLRRYYGEGNIPVAQPTTEGVPTLEELYEMVGTQEYKNDVSYRNKVQKWFKQRVPDNPNEDYII